MKGNAGFTLMEMVLVMVLAGMVAMILGSRFSQSSILDEDLTDCENRLREVVVYARSQALLLRDGSPALTVSQTGMAYTDATTTRSRKWQGAAVTSGTVTLTFDGFGRCTSCAKPVTITLESTDGRNTRSLVVYETGYIGRKNDEN